MQFLFIPPLCIAAGVLLALGYWELYNWVHPSRGGDAAYGRALETMFTLGYAVLAGLILGSVAAIWGYRGRASFNRTLALGAALSLGPPAALFLLSFFSM